VSVIKWLISVGKVLSTPSFAAGVYPSCCPAHT